MTQSCSSPDSERGQRGTAPSHCTAKRHHTDGWQGGRLVSKNCGNQTIQAKLVKLGSVLWNLWGISIVFPTQTPRVSKRFQKSSKEQPAWILQIHPGEELLRVIVRPGWQLTTLKETAADQNHLKLSYPFMDSNGFQCYPILTYC